MIPCYNCLDQTGPADLVRRSTLDHQRTAHHLYLINTSTIIIQGNHVRQARLPLEQYTNSIKTR
jgi:hypothetical protein